MNKNKFNNIFVQLIEKINVNKCIVLFIVLTSLPILYYSFFAHPSGMDDINNSIETHAVLMSESAGVINLLKAAVSKSIEIYNTWQGTYISIFFMTLQPSIFGEQYYFVTTFIMFAFTLISFLYSGKTLLTIINVEKRLAYLLSLVIWFFYVQTIQGPRDMFYWYTGAVHYIPFFCLTLVVAAMLIKGYNKGFSKKTVVISSFYGFIISGGNQLTSFLNILVIFLLIGYIIAFDKNKNKIKPILFPFTSSVLGFILMLVAPGNSVRKSEITYNPTVLETITEIGLNSYFEFALDQWINVSTFLLLIFLTPFISKITKNLKGFKISKLILIFLAQYMLVCAMLCAPYYAMGGPWSEFAGYKATNTVYPVFIIGIILIYSYIIGILQEKEIVSFSLNNFSRFNKKFAYGIFSLCFLLGVFIFGTDTLPYSTSGTILAEIRGGTAQLIKTQWEQRVEILNDESIRDAELPRMTSSFLLGGDGLSEDSEWWTNVAFAEFYGKDSIRIINDEN